MYFLKKNPDGSVSLNKAGRALLDKVYKAPKQHGKRWLRRWKRLSALTRRAPNKETAASGRKDATEMHNER